jgi:hypothetical protein
MSVHKLAMLMFDLFSISPIDKKPNISTFFLKMEGAEPMSFNENDLMTFIIAPWVGEKNGERDG